MIGKLSFSQSFPTPASLSTGQGIFGADDPNWFVSQQCFAAGSEPNPTDISVTYSPAVILSTVPPVWIDPSTLPAPVNNGNWIGLNATAGSDDAGGCARYYRLPINLPANCGTVSVTSPGAYSLVFDGYVDNTLMKVFLNGVNIGVPSGGSFAAGGQLTFTVSGPWLVGMNYLDVLVENGVSVPPNPAGFLMVASPSASSADSDGDGVNNLVDACPCEAGATSNGCPPPNQCNVAAIRTAFTGAGCTELFSCYDGCSLYFYYPTAGSSQAAETFAQSLGGHVVSIQSTTENTCLQSELSSNGFGGVIWIGYTDNVNEGTHYWLDGSPIGYTNWSSGEPNNSGGSEDCVQMYPDGMWNDLNCGNGAASILEVGLCPQATVISNTLQVCIGSSATLSVSTLFGSAPYSYTWLPNIGLASNTGSTVIASPSVTTTYTVASVDRYNCTTYANITLSVNPAPILAVNSATICRGIQTATLIVSGASSYSWSPATGLSSTTGSLVVGSPTASINSYTVTGADALGCVSSNTTFIRVNNIPNITATASQTAICYGQQSSNLSAGGAFSYSWTPSTGLNATIGANVIANPLVTTTYSVGGLNGFGCPNYTTITLAVIPLPTITVNSSSICLGQQTATLTSNGALTYTWAPNTNLSTTTGSVVFANPNANTTYSVLGTDVNGCFNYTTTVVTILVLPTITSNTLSVCIGQQTATFTANGAVNYSWTPSDFLSSTNTSNVEVVNADVETTYTVIGVDANGCFNYTTTVVTMIDLPIIIVSSSSVCPGQFPANILAIGGVNYSWTPSVTFNQPDGSDVETNPSTPTDYTVTGIDANGCTNTATTNVGFYIIPVASYVIDDSVLCIGDVSIITPSGGSGYELQPDNLFTLDEYVVSPQVTTTYTLIAFSDDGCYSINDPAITVTVNPLPIITAFSNTIINIGQTTSINASGGVTYQWNPTSGLACANCAVTDARPLENTYYIVTSSDANGCVNTDTVYVQVDFICGEYFVPNAFTPNGDGMNDYVNLHSACIGTYTFQIFDRWGEKVFETSDTKYSWNGTFRGKPMNTAVFMYRAEGVDLKGSPFSVKGNITLLR